MVRVAEWPLFRKQLLTWLTLRFPRILTVILVNSRFGSEDRTWVLIASVPGHCILITLNIFSRVCESGTVSGFCKMLYHTT